MRATAILLAAGKGKRFKSRVSKALVKLRGVELIKYSLSVLDSHSSVAGIIVVANRRNKKAIEALISRSGLKKACSVVLGGARRQDSVFNALKRTGGDTPLVLIHDSARPFISRAAVSRTIARASVCRAAVLGVPVKATVKQVEGAVVKRTIDRRTLWEIQTPQVFDRGLLIRAFSRFGKSDVTDDSGLVEKLGHKVEVVAGSYGNIKITTPEDILIAQALLKKKAAE